MHTTFFELPHFEDIQKRIRVLFGGEFVVDTKKAKLVWEHANYPTFFFSNDDLPANFLHHKKHTDSGSSYDLVVGKKKAPSSVICYNSGKLAGLFKIAFGAMDAWFEEEEEIFVHPKDPFKRIDVLQSSRHVRVEINGVEVANTNTPKLLFETGLPVRTYIPKTDCRLDLLTPSSLTTQCPYKGEANYYDVHPEAGQKVEGIVWWYKSPNLECAAIRGHLAFYDEKVDVWVDGEKQKRPTTHFS